MIARTWDEWQLAGYHVIKGQKATGRNADGRATFTSQQVEVTREYRPNRWDLDWDDFDDLRGASYGDDWGDKS